MRENLFLRMSKNRGEAEESDTLTSSGRLPVVVFECALLMVHPYPFFVGRKHYVYNEFIDQMIYYHVNDFFQLLSLVRFLYILLSILNITVWQSRSAQRIW